MIFKRDFAQTQDSAQTPRALSKMKKQPVIWRFFLFFLILLIPIPSLSVTIIKKVGHGDCYVVISDGRVVVIDVGPTANVNGLVSLLKTGYTQFDRIVITHIHSDHVGGLITAEQYARQTGAMFSTDLLVSNHGEHDLNLVVRDTKLKPLLTGLRGRLVVAMSDEGMAKLALDSEHLEIRGIKLGGAEGAVSENKSGLVLKVTEIRDGQRRATLFLGDIEKTEQEALFRRADAKEIFADVAAVTLPHHGRPRTLLPEFFDQLKAAAGENVVALHSDATPLQRELAQKAKNAGIKITSTAAPRNRGGDVVVNLFTEKSYLQVGRQPTTLAAIVEKTRGDFITAGDFTADEVVEAVGKYANRLTTASLPAGMIISMPPETWLREEIGRQRQAVAQWITQLRSDGTEQTAAESELSNRVYKLTEEQLRQINQILPGAVARWEAKHATPAEREIRSGIERGWAIASNSNVDEEKLFVQTKWRNEDSPGIAKYIVKDGPNNTWGIYGLGPKNSRGVSSYGKPLGTMRKPSDVVVNDYEVCEYCGRKSVGHCHLRDKYVCEAHRYFTQDGVNWRCP